MPKTFKSLEADTKWTLVSKNRAGTVILTPDIKQVVKNEYGQNETQVVKRSIQIQFIPVEGQKLGRCQVASPEVKKLLVKTLLWNTPECLLENEIVLDSPKPEHIVVTGTPEVPPKNKGGRPRKIRNDEPRI